MKHVKAISIKFIVISIVLYSILASLYSATIGNIFLISVLVTGAAYIIGDLFILPRFGNAIATIADFGLSFVAIWLLSGMLMDMEYGFLSASLFSALLITLSEAVFHLYMQKKVLGRDEDIYVNRRAESFRKFQTEFSEDEHHEDFIRLHNDEKEENK